jgi:hypothetical protein
MYWLCRSGRDAFAARIDPQSAFAVFARWSFSAESEEYSGFWLMDLAPQVQVEAICHQANILNQIVAVNGGQVSTLSSTSLSGAYSEGKDAWPMI